MIRKPRPISLLIVYTGGTIGMKRDAETGALCPLAFDNIMDEIPELGRSAYQLSSFAFRPLIDSSNMDPDRWIQLAEIIHDNYDRFDGFVILHGTDTMSFTASALSFTLENLSKPVVMTGSQLPIDIPRTDARENLLTAIEIAAAKYDGYPAVPEVCIYFQSQLFRGNRTIKHNAEEFKAFQSFNYPVLGESGVHIRFNFRSIRYPEENSKFSITPCFDRNVAILKLFPGITQQMIQHILNMKGLRGVVIETYGSGNAPNDEWFLKEIEKAIASGIIMISVTQCSQGFVEMGEYDTSRHLENLGVISGLDITTEAAITKLMYLLGKYTEKLEIITNLNKSLRGEISIS